ncbi:MAG: F0F1 ATP synthase subunit A [Patescibacteria group bacterium]|jgi:F-type H+-transporting ATPase subunit a
MTIPPIAAEPIFHLGSFPVTNSLINAWIAVGLFVVFAAFVRAKLTSGKPNRFQSAVEGLLEFLLGYVDQVTQDRKKSKKFLPLIGTLFLFILVSNWMGLIPGVGSITRTIELHGEIENAPIFRPANADLNLTLAMALLTVVVSHFVGMITVGFFVHWNKFIALGTLFKNFKKGGVNIMVGLVETMVGVIELSAEIAKVVSLSLRLFGNIFAGEVLITVMYSLVSYVVPLPFMALELIVGMIQATVFAMLALVYLTILSEKPHGDHEEEHHEKAHAAQIAHAS